VLVQVPRGGYSTKLLQDSLSNQLKQMASQLHCKVIVAFDDLKITVIGPAQAHDLAEQVTPFERAIEELPE